MWPTLALPRFTLSTALAVLALLEADAANAGTLINFETLPDGSVPIAYTPIGASYAALGVVFSSPSGPQQPTFSTGYGQPGQYFAGVWTVPARLRATFDVPVYEVSADVMAADGYGVLMAAWGPAGQLLGQAVSAPLPQFWKGRLSLESAVPIARVEWWPSYDLSAVGIDNLIFAVPEPATLSLALVAGAACRRRR